MEVLGGVAAVVDILARSLELLQRARSAWVRQKNGIKYLEGVSSDVEALITLLKLVWGEKALHQKEVIKAAALVQEKADNLHATINDLDQKAQIGGGFSRFVGHFLEGQAEPQRLEAMRRDLNDAKSTLIISLQMAQVGMVQSLSKGDIVFNFEIINQIDQRVQLCPGLEEGLRIAELIRQRGWKDEKGKWHLNGQDLAELERPPPYVYKPAPLAPGQNRTVVQMNEVHGATFIGAGVGKDGGNEHSIFHPDELIVTKNKATGGAIFIGGGTSASNVVYMATRIPGFMLPQQSHGTR